MVPTSSTCAMCPSAGVGGWTLDRLNFYEGKCLKSRLLKLFSFSPEIETAGIKNWHFLPIQALSRGKMQQSGRCQGCSWQQ